MTTATVVMWKKQKLFFVFLVELGVFLFEFLNSTCSINQFLLAGEEGMTGGTDFNLHFTIDGAELKFIATGTNSIDFMVFWMDIRFHFLPPNIFFPSRECNFIKLLNIIQFHPFSIKKTHLPVHSGKKFFIGLGLTHPIKEKFHGISRVHG